MAILARARLKKGFMRAAEVQEARVKGLAEATQEEAGRQDERYAACDQYDGKRFTRVSFHDSRGSVVVCVPIETLATICTAAGNAGQILDFEAPGSVGHIKQIEADVESGAFDWALTPEPQV